MSRGITVAGETPYGVGLACSDTLTINDHEKQLKYYKETLYLRDFSTNPQWLSDGVPEQLQLKRHKTAWKRKSRT